MSNRLRARVIELLATETTTGGALAILDAGADPAWPGVVRVDTTPGGVTERQEGYVNLYASGHVPDSLTGRPAVYLGMRRATGWDDLGQPLHNGWYSEMRQYLIPVVVSVVAKERQGAERLAGCLHRNVRSILWAHRQDDGYWWDLDFDGSRHGIYEAPASSGTGGGTTGAAEAISVLPVRLHYIRKAEDGA